MPLEAVVIPLKRFDQAKNRLRSEAPFDVSDLAEKLARGVIENSHPRHVIVLSENWRVSRFARALGVEVRRSSATTLNNAVQSAYRALGRRYERLIIVHGDLRYPGGLGTFEPGPGITVVTDHHGEGTNVLVVPTKLDFHFAYGTQSLQHHVSEAHRLHVDSRVITDSPWRFDVDELSDLEDE